MNRKSTNANDEATSQDDLTRLQTDEEDKKRKWRERNETNKVVTMDLMVCCLYAINMYKKEVNWNENKIVNPPSWRGVALGRTRG